MKNFAGNLYIYCEELYNTNKNLIELIGLDCIDHILQMESIFLRISCSLMKLIPCNRRNKEKELALVPKDGVLLFQTELSFLRGDYDQLLTSHCALLGTLKDVRDKTEHCPHKLEFMRAGSGTTILPRICFGFQGEETECQLYSEDIVKLIIDLNKIFDKIVGELRTYISTYHSEEQSHPYYRKLSRLDYGRFTRLLESSLLLDISKSMQSF